jgi:telomere length regulation protein
MTEEHVVISMVTSTIDGSAPQLLNLYLRKLKAHEQRKYFDAILTLFATKYLNSIQHHMNDAPLENSVVIAGVAALIYDLIKEHELLQDHVVTLLTRSTLVALDDSLATRRSAIAAIAKVEGSSADHKFQSKC